MSVAPTSQFWVCHVVSTDFGKLQSVTDFGKLQSVMGWPPKAKFLVTSNGTRVLYTGMSRFAPALCYWKTSHKSNTEFPFSTVYFLGAGGLITSSYIAYDYTCSGNMDLYSIYVLHIHYTGCHRRNGPNFGRVFLMLDYTDITWNTYIQSWTVTEIMAREKCGHLAFPRNVRLQLWSALTLRLWRHKLRPTR